MSSAPILSTWFVYNTKLVLVVLIGCAVWLFAMFSLSQVLSKGVIVQHGYKTIGVTAANAVLSGTVSFMLSVGPNLAPVVQILAYCVLPSESVVADGTNVDTEKCFRTQV